jgi:predicted nucleotide-binding protein (sugar kinase/HSP70/actin superfamily)
LRARLWEAVVAGDALLKCGCRLRPYEENQGDVNRVLAQAVADVESAFAAGDAAKPAIQRAIQALLRVPLRPSEPLPLVGVAGEIYVRSNPFSNANVVRAIEQAGGEAWPTPAAEWVLYAAALQERHARRAPLNIAQRLLAGLGNRFLLRLEHEYATIATPILQDRREPSMADILREGSLMLPVEFGGEAIMTVGRARLFARQGAALVVSVAPFGCMPSTISSALLREAQAQIGIPVVSMFYDGEQDANDRLAVFLNSLGVRGDAARRGASARARPLEPAQQGSCSAP